VNAGEGASPLLSGWSNTWVGRWIWNPREGKTIFRVLLPIVDEKEMDGDRDKIGTNVDLSGKQIRDS
jgi:hypothetical protein